GERLGLGLDDRSVGDDLVLDLGDELGKTHDGYSVDAAKCCTGTSVRCAELFRATAPGGIWSSFWSCGEPKTPERRAPQFPGVGDTPVYWRLFLVFLGVHWPYALGEKCRVPSPTGCARHPERFDRSYGTFSVLAVVDRRAADFSRSIT